jgi:asparagine N-glycosylation enzyme membrane subunit Stt3
MVSVFDPAVLLTLAWLVVLFAAGFRYRWGSLPPARALVVVSAALFWLAFSLTQVSAFLAAPYDDVLVAVAALLLLGGAALFARWWRRRHNTTEPA